MKFVVSRRQEERVWVILWGNERAIKCYEVKVFKSFETTIAFNFCSNYIMEIGNI